MPRRHVPTLLGALTLLLLPTASGAQQQPDIVLIMTDDQPWHTLPYMPNVQRLIGDQGARFEAYYVSTSLCGPSRATTLLGQHSHQTGIKGNSSGAKKMFAKKSSLSTWLRAAGYHTGIVGKWVNNYEEPGGGWPTPAGGWDVWRVMRVAGYYNYQISVNGAVEAHGSSPADYSTRVLRDHAVAFLSSAPADAPLFLYFAPFAPHAPFTADPVDTHTFDNLSWGISFLPNFNEADVSDKPAWVRALAPAKDQKMRLQHEQQIEALQAVDRAVVDVLAAAEGRGRPLYVIYTSDNGWALGAHRWTQKWCGYDECSREPLLVRGPGIEAGTVVPATQLASNVDLAVTISDWAGATPDIPVDGVSLRPLLDDPDISWNRDVLLELRGGPHVNRKHWAIRTHDGWVWTEYDNGDRELYDMNADPWQLQSLHANPAFAAKRAELAARLAPMKN